MESSLDHNDGAVVAWREIRQAQARLKRNHVEGIQQLSALFRRGWLPEPIPDGRYQGEFLAFDVAPGLTALAALAIGRWAGWQGKLFSAAEGCGCNILLKRARPFTRLVWPLYRGAAPDGIHTYTAFTFRLRPGPGLFDPDRQVLKIEYDLPENPPASLHRLVDELVQVAPNLYLGKAHFHWWWGGWQTVMYFSLIAPRT